MSVLSVNFNYSFDCSKDCEFQVQFQLTDSTLFKYSGRVRNDRGAQKLSTSVKEGSRPLSK